LRIVIELVRNGSGGVHGVLFHEGEEEPQRFSGWLELLRLLEELGAAGNDEA
jgi:hypothetical protein